MTPSYDTLDHRRMTIATAFRRCFGPRPCQWLCSHAFYLCSALVNRPVPLTFWLIGTKTGNAVLLTQLFCMIFYSCVQVRKRFRSVDFFL